MENSVSVDSGSNIVVSGRTVVYRLQKIAISGLEIIGGISVLFNIPDDCCVYALLPQIKASQKPLLDQVPTAFFQYWQAEKEFGPFSTVADIVESTKENIIPLYVRYSAIEETPTNTNVELRIACDFSVISHCGNVSSISGESIDFSVYTETGEIDQKESLPNLNRNYSANSISGTISSVVTSRSLLATDGANIPAPSLSPPPTCSCLSASRGITTTAGAGTSDSVTHAAVKPSFSDIVRGYTPATAAIQADSRSRLSAGTGKSAVGTTKPLSDPSSSTNPRTLQITKPSAGASHNAMSTQKSAAAPTK